MKNLSPNRIQVSLSKPELVLNPYTGTSGVYSAVVPDVSGLSQLEFLCKKLGVEFHPDETHCTVVYSKEAALTDPATAEPVAGKAFWYCLTHIEHWTGHDGKTYIVAGVGSPAVVMEHARLRRLGAKHSFTPFKAHITLSSDVEVTPEMQAKIDELNLELALAPGSASFINQKIVDVKKD